MLEQQGDSVAAFDIYKSILTRYPNTPEAKNFSETYSKNAIEDSERFREGRTSASPCVVSVDSRPVANF